MIVVTGGAGFIGSNVVRALNQSGRFDVVVVDDLTDGRKAANLTDLALIDYFDRDEFLSMISSGSPELADVTAIVHQGAISSTTESNGRLVMTNNYGYSKAVLQFAVERELPVVYASSASVYGTSTSFAETPENERPLNVYALSKVMTDNFARRLMKEAGSQIVGLRYFNVYGPRERHKDEMASIVTRVDDEIANRGTATLFGPSHGHDAGGQRRDFVHVDDVVGVVLWFLEHPDLSGIYNCGTGTSASFLDAAEAVISVRGRGRVEFTEFPSRLWDAYQHNTSANLDRLRDCGYTKPFQLLRPGVESYLANRDER